jgi:hypothetical protein
MIRNVPLQHCKTLQEFYDTLYRAHESSEGKGYCDHHHTMEEYLTDCESYREFGVLQGATAAKAGLCDVKYIQAVDVILSRFSPYSHLFEQEGIELELHESSTVPHPVEFKGKKYTMTEAVANLKPVDFMLIDDIHEHDHVLEELILHSHSVKKYIMLHDTYKIEKKVNDSLHQAALKFCEQSGEWTVEKYSKVTVGHTLLKRV